MPVYELQVKATLENVTNLGVDDPDTFDWGLKFKCSSCREVSERMRYMCVRDVVDVPNSRGSANYIEKCGFCGKTATVNVLPDSFDVIKESDQFTTICKFETRGTEPVEFELSGLWKCEGTETGTKFVDVEINDAWADFDEKADAPVTIMDVESRFK